MTLRKRIHNVLLGAGSLLAPAAYALPSKGVMVTIGQDFRRAGLEIHDAIIETELVHGKPKEPQQLEFPEISITGRG